MQLIMILTKLTHDEFIEHFSLRKNNHKILILGSQYVNDNVFKDHLERLNKDFYYCVELLELDCEEETWVEVKRLENKSEAIQCAIDRESETMLARVMEVNLNNDNVFVIYQTIKNRK